MLKLVNNNNANNKNNTKSSSTTTCTKATNNQRSTLITPSYKNSKNKDDEEDSSDDTEITDHEEFDTEGSAPIEDQDYNQHHPACDLQQADSCHSIEDRLSLLVKAAERINATTTTSPMSDDKNTNLVIGKNGKPTRPFNAYKKEPSVPSVNATPTSLNNSANNKQIPLDVGNSQQQQQEQQNNLLQLLSQHLAQQQQQGNKSPTNTGETASASTTGSAPNKNPQLVINLEDVLNVIMNAASIVSSQSSTPQPAQPGSPTVAKQPQQQTVSPIPCNNQHEVPSSSKQVTQASHAVSPSVSQPMTNPSTSPVNQNVVATTSYDDIISQHTINTYIGLDNNNSSSNGGSDLSEFSSLDSLTKMSLMSSNDFCSQYKKRIQQAKERMIQKRVQEEELARQQQEINEKAKNEKKSRKRTHNVNRSSISTESDDQPITKANSQHSDMSDTPSVPSSTESTNAGIKSNLVKMFLMNNGSSQSGMSEKQQGLFHMVLSALAMNEDTTATSAGNNDTARQMSSLNGLEIENASGDALLNSYPPKKRHRMQQQQEQQMNSTNPCSSESNTSNNMHEITNITGQQDQQMDKQQRNKETIAKRMYDDANKSEISINVNGSAHPGISGNSNSCQNRVSGCSLSSSSSSMSTSPTPQSSPSLYTDSASSSSSYGASSVNNNLNRIEINNRKNRPSRALSSNSSSSSSRSNSNNASNSKQTSSSSSNKRAAVNNSTNSMEAQLALLPRRESRTVIDIDQMSEGPDKDEAYRERRRKNNEAAKRSRDARRAKEDDIALRAAILERENLQLKVEVSQLKQETNKLRCLLYNS